MKVAVHHECRDFKTYRAARVKSLFNAEYGHRFDLEIETDLETFEWSIGVVAGPSGSGKTSIGRLLPGSIYDMTRGWPDDRPVIDAIAPEGDFNRVTAALSAVGLGSVPSWLRPYKVLSNGEQFRAGLARLLLEGPDQVVLDEFTSVIDRQIARIAAGAFQKAWRRQSGRRIVLLTPHYDIIPWVQPDWIIDTKNGGRYERSRLRRPEINLEIVHANGSYWKNFKEHYYLDLPMPIAAHYFLGLVKGEPVAHLAVSPMFHCGYYRATRLVVMPEWQGAGIGVRFLNEVCQHHLDGKGRCGRKLPVLFHTSHPQLAAALRKSHNWIMKSARLYQPGGKSLMKPGGWGHGRSNGRARYGGHFRAIQGFAYIGGHGVS